MESDTDQEAAQTATTESDTGQETPQTVASSDTDTEWNSMQPKKRYVPPQPDKDTFASQKEFLASLTPSVVPISSLESNNLRCPHCWKYYGESDPDADNAERPTKFRCGHVFGEACMKDHFRLPQPVIVKLEPLKFSSKKSRQFGMSVEQYVLTQWTQTTLPTSEAVFTIFMELLTHSPGHHLPECLINDWITPVLRLLVIPTSIVVSTIYFSENGVVIDYGYTSSVASDAELTGEDPFMGVSSQTSTNSPLGNSPMLIGGTYYIAATSSSTTPYTVPQLQTAARLLPDSEAPGKATQLEGNKVLTAGALAKVFFAFQKYKEQFPDSLPTHKPTTPLSLPRIREISQATLIMHAKDLNLKARRYAYMVAPPCPINSTVYDSDSDEANGADDKIEADIDEESDPAAVRPFLIVHRRMCFECSKCYPNPKARDEAVKSTKMASTPESVSWFPRQEPPRNSCPLCKRILFKFGKQHGRSSISSSFKTMIPKEGD
ncbi:hypothetical protein K491DRAFT_690065 [Lophiostoma macrostomum CBS 122681]|uniref:RING-type domain-containing protein n=1 Tax=Lophiostoma macrostomum CBS 122681 TaxID=1314788 RepID=A0A6A6THZ8_9PLEO|nr:hypothetical protein K491DRAFT_690065 [Lophiostoma macrostomum CBS 122681]